MAVGSINFFEKHIEKLFLGLAAAGLAGVVIWQYGSGPATVKVAGSDVPMDQAYGKIEEQAKRLQGRMREPDPKVPQELAQRTNLLDGFKQRLAANVSPNSTMWAPSGYELKGIAAPGGIAVGDYVLPPELPTIVKPIAHAFMSTIHGDEVTNIAGLGQYLDTQAAPFDKGAVSVEVSFDPVAVQKALAADGDGPGKGQAMPQAWWIGTEIVAIDLVRQEQKSDGTWGSEEIVPDMPGRASFKERLADKQLDGAGLQTIVSEATAVTEVLLRPEWYRRAELLANQPVGDEWVQPSKRVTANVPAPAQNDLDRILSDRESLLTRISNLEKTLEKVRAQPGNNGGGGGAGGGGGGKKPLGGGGGGGIGSGGGSGGSTAKDPKQTQIEQLQRDIDRLKRQVETLDRKIVEKGGKVPGAPVNPANPANPANPTTPVAAAPRLLEAKAPITIWAHDIAAKRGATYHYQLRVRISNPLFNKPAQLREADKALAAQSTLTVNGSEWSDPVHVDDQVYYFVTGANGRDGRGVGNSVTARAELFYYTWGYWFKSEIALEPGDSLIGEVSIPDASKLANAQPQPAPQPQDPGGGRKPVIGGGPAPAPNGPAVAAVTIPMTTKTVERDAFLLDCPLNPISVGTVAGAKQTFQALLRDVNGELVLKDPVNENKQDRLQQFRESATDWKKYQTGSAANPAGNPAPVGNPPPLTPPGGLTPPTGLPGGG